MILSFTLPRFLIVNAICFALVSGCATAPEPVIRTVEVLVPVAVPCVPKDFPQAPEYPDEPEALLSALDPAARWQIMGEGYHLRRPRAQALEAVVEGCR
jgi:hypothetical protein